MSVAETSSSTSRRHSEVWQARVPAQFARELEADADVLGLEGRSDIVRAALELLHKQAAEERMARDVARYYGEGEAPLPTGVVSRGRRASSG